MFRDTSVVTRVRVDNMGCLVPTTFNVSDRLSGGNGEDLKLHRSE